MSSYLERNIKDLLTETPALGEVLTHYGIGCVTCAAGTCQLKDFVQYHSLPEDKLQALMESITAIIDPEGRCARPQFTPTPAPTSPRKFSYSPPLKNLVQEHALIKRFLALIPAILATVNLGSATDRQLVLDGVDFIRSYADRFHHAKEEEILFKHFDENQQVIRVMLQDHADGRDHVQAILAAVELRDHVMLATHMHGYRELLSEHITREDEILYPWMDRQFSMTQVGELFREFSEADSRFEQGMPERFTQFIEKLEQSLKGEHVL